MSNSSVPGSCPHCGAALKARTGSMDGALHISFACGSAWHGWPDGTSDGIQKGLCSAPAEMQAEIQARLGLGADWQPLVDAMPPANRALYEELRERAQASGQVSVPIISDREPVEVPHSGAVVFEELAEAVLAESDVHRMLDGVSSPPGYAEDCCHCALCSLADRLRTAGGAETESARVCGCGEALTAASPVCRGCGRPRRQVGSDDESEGAGDA